MKSDVATIARKKVLLYRVLMALLDICPYHPHQRRKPISLNLSEENRFEAEGERRSIKWMREM